MENNFRKALVLFMLLLTNISANCTSSNEKTILRLIGYDSAATTVSSWCMQAGDTIQWYVEPPSHTNNLDGPWYVSINKPLRGIHKGDTIRTLIGDSVVFLQVSADSNNLTIFAEDVYSPSKVWLINKKEYDQGFFYPDPQPTMKLPTVVCYSCTTKYSTDSISFIVNNSEAFSINDRYAHKHLSLWPSGIRVQVYDSITNQIGFLIQRVPFSIDVNLDSTKRKAVIMMPSNCNCNDATLRYAFFVYYEWKHPFQSDTTLFYSPENGNYIEGFVHFYKTPSAVKLGLRKLFYPQKRSKFDLLGRKQRMLPLSVLLIPPLDRKGK